MLGPAGAPIVRAAENFEKTKGSTDRIAGALRGAGAGARNIADQLDGSLAPALQKTRDRLNEARKALAALRVSVEET